MWHKLVCAVITFSRVAQELTLAWCPLSKLQGSPLPLLVLPPIRSAGRLCIASSAARFGHLWGPAARPVVSGSLVDKFSGGRV